jgi:hypothetical protein
VGLFTDATGSTCSFSGNDPGFVTAYVVLRPGPDGFRGVTMSAPVPPCLGAVFLGDQVSEGFLSVGSSQAAISITSGDCQTNPVHLLTIYYYRSGSTEACCPYSIFSGSGGPDIAVTPCAGPGVVYSGVTSHFNANETCACTGGIAPTPPGNPHPLDNETAVSRTPLLQWFASDNDGDLADFDVYLGTDPTPPLVASHVTTMTYQQVTALDPLTLYYWRIVAHDLAGRETAGPTWQFTTRPVNSPPTGPFLQRPSIGAVVTTSNVTLDWSSSDLDEDPLTYDLYFGTVSPPPLLRSGLTASNYNIDLQYEQTYYWQVVVHDSNGGHTVSGGVWRFATHQVPAQLHFLPDPPNGQTAVPVDATLRWGNFFPDGTTYEIYFGYWSPENVPTAVVTTPYYKPAAGLEANHYYVWYIIAQTHVGNTFGTFWGPEWSFYTGPPQPNTPTNPSPAYDAITQASPTLQWSVATPNGRPLTFNVYFGTSEYPPLVATGLTNLTYSPVNLDFGVRYFWRVLALSDFNAQTSGPTWTFTVDPSLDQPPSVPANPQPFNNSQAGLTPALSWSSTDPEGKPMTFAIHFGTTDPPPFFGYTSATNYHPGGQLAPNERYYWRVVAGDGINTVPGPVWNFLAVERPVPVAFTHFTARASNGGIRVEWQLHSDEAMESYTLYRRAGSGTAASIATGPVDGVEGSYFDDRVISGTTYQYELEVRTTDGNLFRSPVATQSAPVLALRASQNYPNPFNPKTTIRYDLPTRARVRLSIVDVGGRIVRRLVDDEQPAGARDVSWDGTDDRHTPVASGLYFYVLDAGGKRLTRKLVLLEMMRSVLWRPQGDCTPTDCRTPSRTVSQTNLISEMYGSRRRWIVITVGGSSLSVGFDECVCQFCIHVATWSPTSCSCVPLSRISNLSP